MSAKSVSRELVIAATFVFAPPPAAVLPEASLGPAVAELRVDVVGCVDLALVAAALAEVAAALAPGTSFFRFNIIFFGSEMISQHPPSSKHKKKTDRF